MLSTEHVIVSIVTAVTVNAMALSIRCVCFYPNRLFFFLIASFNCPRSFSNYCEEEVVYITVNYMCLPETPPSGLGLNIVSGTSHQVSSSPSCFSLVYRPARHSCCGDHVALRK